MLRERAGCDSGGLCDILSFDSFLSSLNLKRELVLVDIGLGIAGDMVLRKSRYADGGVRGVRIASCPLRKPGE